ncbi:MAG: gliding motility-associated C-terminal domain-containing protein [Flavobacteriales bacterium]|nr:gliding motility-associated C-terminal domain-containing protein [Flavobacteriales bacterium]
MRLNPIIFSAYFLCGLHLHSQDTFQKSFVDTTGNVQVFDAIQTSDGGYAMAGLSGTSSQQMLLAKLDDCGNLEWAHTYGASSSINNVNIRVMETTDNTLVMLNNSGAYFSNTMDVVLVRTMLDGTLIWQKEYGGTGNDIGNSLIETADGNYAVAGGTSAFGSDEGSGYDDAMVMKIAPDGTVLWSKTFGNSTAYDDAYSVAEDPADSSLVIGGRYIVNGTFYSFMLKTDGDGNQQWLRAYGRDNHGNFGYTVMVDTQGDYVLAGSTTTLGSDFTSYGDPFVVKADPLTGDTLWIKVYPPSDNSFDNASAILEEPNGNYAIAVATASYSSFTVGFVPNKHGLLRISPSGGALVEAKIFNQGGSHYPFLRKADAGGYVYSGFGNQYTSPCCNFEPLLIRTDDDFDSGCNENDVTSLTGTEVGTWQVETPPFTEGTGYSAADFTGQADYAFTSINTLCASSEPIVADFGWAGNCMNDSIPFTDLSTGDITAWLWDFGNGETSTEQNPSTVFDDNTSYEVVLTVSDGCVISTLAQDVVIAFEAMADAGPDMEVIEGEEVTIGGSPTGPNSASFLWMPPNSLDSNILPNPDAYPTLTTQYVVTVTMSNGCYDTDTVLVIVLEKPPVDTSGSLFIPNIFSPNYDGTNDLLWVYGGPFTEFHLEIFNRWGEKVFESDNQFSAWDGKYRGMQAQAGVYYFKLNLGSTGGTSSTQTGNITLLR